MNFLLKPTEDIFPNAKKTEDQEATAITFMDKLISLGVLQEQWENQVWNNMPLFLVPNPGQEGQWRCIADGKAGSQNIVCVNDPMHLL